MNKTSISSVVCLDIIDFSKKSESEQQAAKAQLNTRINHAVLDIPEKDRLIVNTDHGAIVTCSGPLENALEDALFIALTIRDEVLSKNINSDSPLYLLMAINLGSVQLEKNTNPNEAPKIKGEGLLEAQRIMSFANPNQILVSRAYYDMASKLTLEVAQMFEKYDMHAYEHDIYAVRRLNEKSVVDNAAAALDHIEKQQEEAAVTSTLDWRLYFLPALLALVMFFVLFNWMKSDEASYEQEQLDLGATIVDDVDHFDVDVLPDPLPEILPEPAIVENTSDEKEAQQKSVVVKKKSEKKAEKATTSTVETERQPSVVEPEVEARTVEPSTDSDQSTWDTLKGNEEPKCSQAQKAMNQCN